MLTVITRPTRRTLGHNTHTFKANIARVKQHMSALARNGLALQAKAAALARNGLALQANVAAWQRYCPVVTYGIEAQLYDVIR